MKKLALTIGALAFPLVSFAQLGNVSSLVDSIGGIVNQIIPILFALALLGFFYGLVKYIFGKEENKEQAKKTMIMGIVALFVMASVWGLVAYLQSAFLGGNAGGAPDVKNLIPG
jgi:cation transporter-like permease